MVCQHAKCDCRLWKVLWYNCVFGNLYILVLVWIVITSPNLHKLYFEVEAKLYSIKINLCKHSWLRQSEFFMFKIDKRVASIINVLFLYRCNMSDHSLVSELSVARSDTFLSSQLISINTIFDKRKAKICHVPYMKCDMWKALSLNVIAMYKNIRVCRSIFILFFPSL